MRSPDFHAVSISRWHSCEPLRTLIILSADTCGARWVVLVPSHTSGGAEVTANVADLLVGGGGRGGAEGAAEALPCALGGGARALAGLQIEEWDGDLADQVEEFAIARDWLTWRYAVHGVE